MKSLTTLFFLALSFPGFSQSFEGCYGGWWARTSWLYCFQEDGSFERTTEGHFGNTTLEGRYLMRGDTIVTLQSNDTIGNRDAGRYIVDENNMLIDLDLRFDYGALSENEAPLHNSDTRAIKYPQTPPKCNREVRDLEKVLNLALNSDEVAWYYPTYSGENNTPIIANYQHLEATVLVNGDTLSFQPLGEIDSNLYVEITDINQNKNDISLYMNLHKEGIHFMFHFTKVNGEWTYREPAKFPLSY